MTILGHDAPIAAFLAAMRGPRLHHAWLMAGREGLGKATVAALLSKRMLCEAGGPEVSGDGHEVSDTHPLSKLIDARTHPDFHIVERLPRDMKPLRDLDRRDWPADVERARNINVEQIRALGAQFALKPSYSSRRVVLVDAIDDLERGAANALLKNLEEPPAGTIFLLVSHAPGRLLPTIRSRCRLLRFEALGDELMQVALRRHLPDATDAELSAVVIAGGGSPGRARAHAGLDLAGIDVNLKAIAETGDASNKLRSDLAAALSAKTAQKRYEAFLTRVPNFIAGQARQRTGQALGTALDAWDAARKLAESAVRQSLDPQMTAFALGSHVASLAARADTAKA